MGEEKSTNHDLDQVWNRIDEMKTDWAETKSELSSVVSSVEDMKAVTRGLANDFRAFTNKPTKDTDYKSIILIALAVAGMAGGLVAATIAPMNNLITKHDKQILKELEESAIHRKAAGEIKGTLDGMEKVSIKLFDDHHDRLLKIEREISEHTATLEYAVRHIYSVDERGNRKDVIKTGEAP